MRSKRASILAPVLLLAGCVGAPTDDGHVDSETQGFTNNLKYVDCDLAQAVKIGQASKYLYDQIFTGASSGIQQTPLYKCLQSAVLSGAEGNSAAEIYRKMASTTVTTITCGSNDNHQCDGLDTWAGCSFGDKPSGVDSFELDSDWLAGVGTEQLAGVMAHEIAHNRGFRHHFEGQLYEQSVPQQLLSCVQRGVPNGTTRTGFTVDQELGPVGAQGSAAGSDVVEFSRYNSYLGDIGYEADNTGITSLAMANTRTADKLTCPEGQLLVGFFGSVKGWIRSLGPVCRSLLPSYQTRGEAVGQVEAGDKFELICPKNYAVRAVRYSHSGGHVTQLKVGCDSRSALAYGSQVHHPARQGLDDRPSSVGMTYGQPASTLRCPGVGVMLGFAAKTDGDVLTGIAGECAVTFQGDHFVPVTGVPLFGAANFTEYSGEVDAVDVPVVTSCTGGRMMVGLRTWVGPAIGSVSGVAPICALPSDWMTSTRTFDTGYPVTGTQNGSRTDIMCGQGQFVTGFDAHGLNGVYGLTVYCRNLWGYEPSDD